MGAGIGSCGFSGGRKVRKVQGRFSGCFFFFFRSSEGFQKVCCQGLLGLSVALLWEGLEAVVRKELGLEVVPSSPALQTPAPRS